MRLFLILLAVTVGMASTPALAKIRYVSKTLQGTRITIAVPDGYCMLDASEGSDAVLIELLETVNKGVNRYLLGFANCKILTSWRAGERPNLNDWGYYLAPLRSPPGIRNMTQAKLNRSLKRALPTAAAKAIKLGEKKIRKALDDLGVDVKIFETKVLGVLDEDRSGLYIGQVQNIVDEDGKSYIVGGVFSTLVLKRKIVSLYMFRNHDRESTFDDLVAFVKFYAKRLHRKN